jgi:hypothetical protein
VKDAYTEWEEGNLEVGAALRATWSDLREVESQLAPLEAERQRLREQVGRLVAEVGGEVTVRGLGRAMITNPSITTTYDKKKVERLLTRLAESHPELAAELAACRTESARAGSLRLMPE